MSFIADGVEFFVHVLSPGSEARPPVSRKQLNSGVGVCYIACAFVCLLFWARAKQQMTSTLCLSSLAGLTGFLLLTLKVRATKSVAGISSKSLEMYLIFYVLRLSNTCFRKGYVPSQIGGLYCCVDVASLLVVLQLLYCIHKTHKWTYQQSHDTMKVLPLLPPCLLLAYFVKLPLSRSPFFDGLWAVSAYAETVALLPQLWMLTKIGGQVEGMTAHFVAAMTARSALGLLFWSAASNDAARFGGTTVAINTVLGTFVLQLLIAADFMYYYAKARLGGQAVVLPPAEGVEI
jgi:ER lumen protein retaining receptor